MSLKFLEYDKDTEFQYGSKSINLRLVKLTSASAAQQPDYIDALVDLYHHILPNVSILDLRKDLSSPDLVHLLLMRLESDVRTEYQAKPTRMLRRFEYPETQFEDFSDDSDPEEDQGQEMVLKVEDFIRNRRRSQFEKQVRNKFPRLEQTLKLEKSDLQFINSELIPLRKRDLLVGALTLKNVKLSDFPATNVCQLLYIGVRTRFQQCKCGRNLLRTAIQYETKAADAFFTFAGSDAVRFFRRCGMTDDPLLCGRFQQLDEDWTDAVPMVKMIKNEGFGVGKDLYGEFQNFMYRKYAAEAYMMKSLCEQNEELKGKIDEVQKEKDQFEQQLALEKARCIMYEQLVQTLEDQLISNGIQPKVNQDEIVSKVLKRK
uniref:N-acetyltransferase domain-containing protein n=1 Tax=Trepomonas sp. PC1 TaxID=1076344 RepID=A0A146K5F7_9EUKA|eukprot:JAP91877.1 hypothetical protein TPC1_16361 [Trepomonas sp. PC1]